MFDEKALQQKLFSMQDEKYRDFNSSLIPTVDKENVIGIRTPILRKFAAEYAKTDEAAEFIEKLPHKYFDENNLHAFIIEKIKDYDKAVAELDKFLPYVDNWATCDLMRPKVLGKFPEKLIIKAKEWIRDNRTYVKRFGIGMLMTHFLGENFEEEYLLLVSEIRSDEYYVNMMKAWFFATALAKKYDSTIPYIENKRLDTWTHNKTIQKAVESYRITKEQKEYLKTLRIMLTKQSF